MARIHLQSGHLAAASHHFEQVAADPTAPRSLKVINTALLAAAEGDWEKTVSSLKEVVDDAGEGEEKSGDIEEKERYIVSCCHLLVFQLMINLYRLRIIWRLRC